MVTFHRPQNSWRREAAYNTAQHDNRATQQNDPTTHQTQVAGVWETDHRPKGGGFEVNRTPPALTSWTDEEEDLVSCVHRKAQRSSLTEADLVNGGYPR